MDFLTRWRGRRVLVTGGTGFVGRHVLRYGQTAGAEVHNISLTVPACGDVIQHTVDLRDYESVKATVREIRPHAIVHLAARGVIGHAGDMADMLRTNVLGLQSILEAVIASKMTPRVVLAGSWFEYGPQERPLTETDPTLPWSEYAASKIAAATIASYYSRQTPIILLRPFSVYGPGEKSARLVPYIVQNAMEGKPVTLTACEQIRDFVYVKDVAEAFWRAVCVSESGSAFQILNIGTGRPTRLREVVQTVSDVLKDYGFSSRIVFGARPYRSGEPIHSVADTTNLQRLLGWKPTMRLGDGIREAVRHIISVES